METATVLAQTQATPRRFIRHFIEMMVVMMLGMMVLGGAFGAVHE